MPANGRKATRCRRRTSRARIQRRADDRQPCAARADRRAGAHAHARLRHVRRVAEVRIDARRDPQHLGRSRRARPRLSRAGAAGGRGRRRCEARRRVADRHGQPDLPFTRAALRERHAGSARGTLGQSGLRARVCVAGLHDHDAEPVPDAGRAAAARRVPDRGRDARRRNVPSPDDGRPRAVPAAAAWSRTWSQWSSRYRFTGHF